MSLELIYIAHMSMYAYLKEQEGPDLSAEDRQRRDRRVPRISLRRYADSSFLYLFKSGNDQALLNCCAVDHATFRELLALFKPVYDKFTVDGRSNKIRPLVFSANGEPIGRQRDLDAIGALGLVLFWFRTRGSVARAISMAFGLTGSQVYRWLKFARKVLLFVLQDVQVAKVCSPQDNEVEAYVAAIAQRYPLAGERRVWAAIDGLKLRLEQSSNYAVQNEYYNGWTGSTYVNSVFLFAPDGRIRMCTINAPGSWHDSTQASYGLYDRMKEVFNRTGARVVVDSAFSSGATDNYLIKSSQMMPIGATFEQLQLNREATSVRQLSEHGMRMIQGQFPRLKDNMKFEDFGDRKVILNLMVLLYNYQTAKIGINTILNTFMPRTTGFNQSAYAYSANGDLELIHETANIMFD